MPDTLPVRLLSHARQRPDEPALREKKYGIWQTWTWLQAAQDLRRMSLGLAALGMTADQNVAVIGSNRPYLYLTFIAVESLSGIPVPLYHDAIVGELKPIVAEIEARYAYAEDQEQLDKLLLIREELAGEGVICLEHIIYDDPRGIANYKDAGLISLDELKRLGDQFDKEHPTYFDSAIERTSPSAVALISYTSGTTSRPKGVCTTHESWIVAASGYADLNSFTSADKLLCYQPPGWAGDFLCSIALWLVTGCTINCPESLATVPIDMRDIGPTLFLGSPHSYEKLATQIHVRIEDASWMKRQLYNHFIKFARGLGDAILTGRHVGISNRLIYGLGNLLVYAPLKNTMGFSDIRVAYSGGAAFSPDLFNFYRSIGINLKQLYGQTETCAYVCSQRDGDVRLDTVGPPLPGVELKIAENGEVLARGKFLFKEYYKRPDATAKAFDAEGYLHTDDAGLIDSKGHLRIIDRVEDVGKLNDGSIFAPNYLENKLKFYPEIKGVVSFGNKRDCACAFINIDLDVVGNWAERQGIPYAGYVDLATNTKVLELIRDRVTQANKELVTEEGMAGMQVARFVILNKELDADDNELTRTNKVRRRFIAEKYKVLVDALYSDKTEQFLETEVKFENGRVGKISASLKIVNAPLVGVAP